MCFLYVPLKCQTYPLPPPSLLPLLLQMERQLQEAQSQLQAAQPQGPLMALAEETELSSLPLSQLEVLQQQLRRDLDRLDSVRLICLSLPSPLSLSLLSMLPSLSLSHLLTFISATNNRVFLSTEYSAAQDHPLHPVQGVPSLRAHPALPALCPLRTLRRVPWEGAALPVLWGEDHAVLHCYPPPLGCCSVAWSR